MLLKMMPEAEKSLGGPVVMAGDNLPSTGSAIPECSVACLGVAYCGLVERG